MAAISLATHMARHHRDAETARRHNSARLWPVAMPSLADKAWNSIAMMFATSTTHSKP